jgi:hypothetical protein
MNPRELGDVFKVFSSHANLLRLETSIIQHIAKYNPSFYIAPNSIVSELQPNIDSIWIDHINDVSIQSKNNPNIILKQLNNLIIQHYIKYATQSSQSSPQSQPPQSQPSLQSPPPQSPPLPQQQKVDNTKIEQTFNQLASYIHTISDNIIKLLESTKSINTRKNVFNYTLDSTKTSENITNINFNHLKSISIVKFEYLNNVFNIPTSKFTIKLSNNTSTVYTLPSGFYPSINSILDTLCNITSDITWSLDPLTLRIKINLLQQQQTSQFAPKNSINQFNIMFHDSLYTILGFSKHEYTGGKIYLGECSHNFGSPIHIDVSLNPILHIHSPNSSLFRSNIPQQKFGEWITELPLLNTAYIELSSTILLDDLVINVSTSNNTPLKWSIQLQVTTLEPLT